MTLAEIDAVETTVRKTDEWLTEISEHLGWTDKRKAYHALRAVLHVLRDRLSPNEAAEFAAQMPLLVRGIYYEGWTPRERPERMRHGDEFISSVLDRMDWDTSAMEGSEVVNAVFSVMADHISEGEVEDVKSVLPREIKDLWP